MPTSSRAATSVAVDAGTGAVGGADGEASRADLRGLLIRGGHSHSFLAAGRGGRGDGVDPKGIEPSTSSVSGKRASRCATGPRSGDDARHDGVRRDASAARLTRFLPWPAHRQARPVCDDSRGPGTPDRMMAPPAGFEPALWFPTSVNSRVHYQLCYEGIAPKGGASAVTPGRDDRTRTCGPLAPSQVRYQLRHIPLWPLERPSGATGTRTPNLLRATQVRHQLRHDPSTITPERDCVSQTGVEPARPLPDTATSRPHAYQLHHRDGADEVPARRPKC